VLPFGSALLSRRSGDTYVNRPTVTGRRAPTSIQRSWVSPPRAVSRSTASYKPEHHPSNPFPASVAARASRTARGGGGRVGAHHRLVRLAPGPADGRVAKAGAGAAAGKGPRRLSHSTRALAGLAGARTLFRHRSPYVATRAGLRSPPQATPAAGRPKARPRHMDQSREVHLAARPHHSPEGHDPEGAWAQLLLRWSRTTSA